MSSVFPRVFGRDLPVAARAEGSAIWDATGKRYLDAAGGAIVVGIGHGDETILQALRDQASAVAYAHGTQFTTEALETYATELAELLPMDSARVYPVSGGSEAVETALKMARAYHLARGEPSRHKVIARWGSYHGNTRGRPGCVWPRAASTPLPAHGWGRPRTSRRPTSTGARTRRIQPPVAHGTPSGWSRRSSRRAGHRGVLHRRAGGGDPREPRTDRRLLAGRGRRVRRFGVLLIADEVMTGFGRTGAWFASGPLGASAGHPGGREGSVVRLPAARPGGVFRLRLRGDRNGWLRPRIHPLPFGGGVRRRPRRSATPPRPGVGRCQPGQGRAASQGAHGFARRASQRRRRPRARG